MNLEEVTLYKQDNDSRIRVWSIRCEDHDIIINHGLLFGSIQEKREAVLTGLGGRTREEQINSRINSRIGKQRDRGYVYNLAQAESSKPTNQLNMPMPMLAKPYKDKIPKGALLQYKYDGNRAMITKQKGQVFAYSRQGKLIKSIGHILKDADHIPEGTILDGELYKHGVALQTLRSWISRDQADSQGLKYICYDIMAPLIYDHRIKLLKEWFPTNDDIVVAPTITCKDMEHLQREFRKAKERGYEGLIVRDPEMGYEDGKRSSGLIKVKSWLSDEFLVMDIIPSKDGWAILVCEENVKGKNFKVSCHGPVDYKYKVMINKELHIGNRITVEYANLTKDGVPFHPVAIAWSEATD